jgi:hypothetical protein
LLLEIHGYLPIGISNGNNSNSNLRDFKSSSMVR